MSAGNEEGKGLAGQKAEKDIYGGVYADILALNSLNPTSIASLLGGKKPQKAKAEENDNPAAVTGNGKGGLIETLVKLFFASSPNAQAAQTLIQRASSGGAGQLWNSSQSGARMSGPGPQGDLPANIAAILNAKNTAGATKAAEAAIKTLGLANESDILQPGQGDKNIALAQKLKRIAAGDENELKLFQENAKSAQITVNGKVMSVSDVLTAKSGVTADQRYAAAVVGCTEGSGNNSLADNNNLMMAGYSQCAHQRKVMSNGPMTAFYANFLPMLNRGLFRG